MKIISFLILFICLAIWNVVDSYSTNQKIQPYQVENFIDYIAQQIEAAEETVDLAIYDFSSDTIHDSIKKACENGVVFRMWVDYDENEDSDSEVNKLIDDFPDQIEVIFDSHKVHSKFVIIDSDQILVGSNNWEDDSSDNVEFLLISNEPAIVSEVLTAYNHVFPNWDASPANLSLSDSASVFYFKRGMYEQYLDLINSAEKSIEGAMFKFTNDKIYAAMVEAAERNVTIFLYLDGDNNDFDGSYSNLLQIQFPDLVTLVYSDDDVKMHCKFIVFDRKLVSMGSANWSPGSETDLDDLFVSTNSNLVQQSLDNLDLMVKNNP